MGPRKMFRSETASQARWRSGGRARAGLRGGGESSRLPFAEASVEPVDTGPAVHDYRFVFVDPEERVDLSLDGPDARVAARRDGVREVGVVVVMRDAGALNSGVREATLWALRDRGELTVLGD